MLHIKFAGWGRNCLWHWLKWVIYVDFQEPRMVENCDGKMNQTVGWRSEKNILIAIETLYGFWKTDLYHHNFSCIYLWYVFCLLSSNWWIAIQKIIIWNSLLIMVFEKRNLIGISNMPHIRVTYSRLFISYDSAVVIR